MSSNFLQGGSQYPCDGVCLRLPVTCFRFELSSSGFGEAVVFCPAVVLRFAPLALEQICALKAAKSGQQRPSVYLKDAFADLLDTDADAVTMKRLERQR